MAENDSGADRFGFNPWVGVGRFPGQSSYVGPLSQWTCSDSGQPRPNWLSVPSNQARIKGD